jgi:hypothetical protein
MAEPCVFLNFLQFSMQEQFMQNMNVPTNVPTIQQPPRQTHAPQKPAGIIVGVPTQAAGVLKITGNQLIPEPRCAR